MPDYADDDMITIEATSFGDAMNTGWFNGFDRMADRAADQLDRRHDPMPVWVSSVRPS